MTAQDFVDGIRYIGDPLNDAYSMRVIRNLITGLYDYYWGLDDIDLGSEDVDAIPFEVVNAKACRPEDREKKVPTPPRRGRRPKKKAEEGA